MEKRILAYEKYIKAELAKHPSKETLKSLRAYHLEMVANFQHERLIHLLVTLFFAALTFIMLCLSGVSFAYLDFSSPDLSLILALSPLYLVTIILFILTACYVRHYYFLENHTQKLYSLSKKLANLEN